MLKLPHNCIHLTAPHSSTLAWKIPWMEEPGRLQSMGSLGVRHDWATSLSFSCIGEGNGHPLQCSCLENPRDGGAWWAAVYGVAQSRTRLKQLSSSCSNILVKLCSKFSKPGFNSTWTMKFQIFKLDLEKAEEADIKLPTSVGSLKKQESSRKTSTSALLTMQKPLTVWITTNWEILKEMGIPDHLTCLLRNLYADQEATVRTRHGTTDWFQIRKGVHQGSILAPCTLMAESKEELKNLLMKV